MSIKHIIDALSLVKFWFTWCTSFSILTIYMSLKITQSGIVKYDRISKSFCISKYYNLNYSILLWSIYYSYQEIIVVLSKNLLNRYKLKKRVTKKELLELLDSLVRIRVNNHLPLVKQKTLVSQMIFILFFR